jgi:hypothetical protein
VNMRLSCLVLAYFIGALSNADGRLVRRHRRVQGCPEPPPDMFCAEYYRPVVCNGCRYTNDCWSKVSGFEASDCRWVVDRDSVSPASPSTMTDISQCVEKIERFCGCKGFSCWKRKARQECKLPEKGPQRREYLAEAGRKFRERCENLSGRDVVPEGSIVKAKETNVEVEQANVQVNIALSLRIGDESVPSPAP